MATPISFYQHYLKLEEAHFSRVDHEDAMVALVYSITQPGGTQLILKICNRIQDYLREVYFLKKFANTLPVPHIIHVIPPENAIDGAILMEYLPSTLLTPADITPTLARNIGSLLARIHLNRTKGYGDLTKPNDLSPDPRIHFTQKFNEGLDECRHHLPASLIQQCHDYFYAHLHLLDTADGPCIIHRDFRPGNIIIRKGHIQGIIDWSSARSSFAQEDFCPMEHENWFSYSLDHKKEFLSGYESIRPVPAYQEMMPLLRLNRAIASIGFTVKRGTWQGRNASLHQFNRQFLDTFFS